MADPIKLNETKMSRIVTRFGPKISRFNDVTKLSNTFEKKAKPVAELKKPETTKIILSRKYSTDDTLALKPHCNFEHVSKEKVYDKSENCSKKEGKCQKEFQILENFKMEFERYKQQWLKLKEEIESPQTQQLPNALKQMNLLKENMSLGLKKLQKSCKDAKENLSCVQTKFEEVKKLLDWVSIEHEDRLSAISRDYECESIQVDLLKKEILVSESLIQKLQREIEKRKNDIYLTTKECSELIENTQVKNWKTTLCIQLVNQIREAVNELVLYDKRIVSVRGLAEFQRRLFHDRLQEIRGNLRVFCRLRPITPSELKQGFHEAKFEIIEKENKLMIQNEDSSQKTGAWTQRRLKQTSSSDSTVFMFDHVFGPEKTQEKIFHETSNLIQSALDGFNVCLFAYGQTGSGKTFTMEGSDDSNEYSNVLTKEAGLIPRTINLIFKTIEELKGKGWKYSVEVSILEIYNETIRDLLQKAAPKNSATLGSRGGDDQNKISCDVKLDSKGSVVVSNLTSVVVNTHQEVYELLSLSRKHRSIAATACNDQSSRSHTVFQLTFFGYRRSDNITIQSKLSLVDLAGSERLEKSLVTGERLKETQHINKSLSCLCDVIYAIAGRKPHIPFRNSKLTMLLKDSLGGKSKTLMFVNISPIKSNLPETLNSLRFASKANSCSLNMPT